MHPDELTLFLQKYAQGSHTEDEHQQFIDWLKTAPAAEIARVSQVYLTIAEMLPSPVLNEQLAGRIEAAIDGVTEQNQSRRVVIHSLRKLFRVAAAALLITSLAAGGYWLVSPKGNPKLTGGADTRTADDVASPATTKAFITLGNGKQIILDDAAAGTLAQEGTIQIAKLSDGSISYQGKSSAVSYNTLQNPRGSQVVRVTLADGTRVWLNSESTLHYPTVFIGEQRLVEVSGEAYFEVAPNASRPFVVKKEDLRIEVLGTHFNVNTYPDEVGPSITLVEGKVKVHSGKERRLLFPGQQALVDGTGAITLNKGVAVERILAWKNGYFHFDNADLKTVMQQLSRWYDAQIEYRGEVPGRTFSGEIDRSLSLKDVLEGLTFTHLKFDIEGKKVIVLPQPGKGSR